MTGCASSLYAKESNVRQSHSPKGFSARDFLPLSKTRPATVSPASMGETDSISSHLFSPFLRQTLAYLGDIASIEIFNNTAGRNGEMVCSRESHVVRETRSDAKKGKRPRYCLTIRMSL